VLHSFQAERLARLDFELSRALKVHDRALYDHMMRCGVSCAELCEQCASLQHSTH